MLASGENNHKMSDRNNQSETIEKNQYMKGTC